MVSLGGVGQGCGSTPPVVPGAAPALAEAGVGGFPSRMHPQTGGLLSDLGWLPMFFRAI